MLTVALHLRVAQYFGGRARRIFRLPLVDVWCGARCPKTLDDAGGASRYWALVPYWPWRSVKRRHVEEREHSGLVYHSCELLAHVLHFTGQ